MKKIAIAGCGWLGSQLGEHLVKQGFQVYGSYRRDDHCRELSKLNIVPFKLELNNDATTSVLDAEIIDAEWLIIALPPVNRNQDFYYSKVLLNIASQFSKEMKVIMISSTSVYPLQEGAFNERYPEERLTLNPIVHAERTLRDIMGTRLCVIRAGGLIGPDRHPINQLSGKNISSDGSGPVSLIHSKDLIKLISILLSEQNLPAIINGVYPIGMTRKEYYPLIADKRSMPSPVYGEVPEPNRVIIPGWLISEKFRFEEDLYLI